MIFLDHRVKINYLSKQSKSFFKEKASIHNINSLLSQHFSITQALLFFRKLPFQIFQTKDLLTLNKHFQQIDFLGLYPKQTFQNHTISAVFLNQGSQSVKFQLNKSIHIHCCCVTLVTTKCKLFQFLPWEKLFFLEGLSRNFQRDYSDKTKESSNLTNLLMWLLILIPIIAVKVLYE